jgi:MFS family permease
MLVALPTLSMALGYIGFAVAPSLLFACFVATATGIGNGIQWVAVVTAVQETTEDEFQGRVAGLLEAVVTGAPGIAFVLGGAITTLFDPRTAFAVAGTGVLLVVVIGAFLLRGLAGTRITPRRAAAASESAL